MLVCSPLAICAVFPMAGAASASVSMGMGASVVTED